MKPIQAYNRTISLPSADLPILDSLAHHLGIASPHKHALAALLRALVSSHLVLTSAATPPPYTTDWTGKIFLRDKEFHVLLRLCAGFELYGAKRRPSLSVLLHALAVGSATVERFDDQVARLCAPPSCPGKETRYGTHPPRTR